MENAVDHIWYGQYAAGVPRQVNPDNCASLAEVLETSCQQYRDRIAYECMGTELSYDDLDRLSQDFASYLQNVLKLDRGARIALMMPNLLQYPVALFGVLRAGLTVVNVNPLYTPRELEHQLRDSGARAIVIVENFCHTLQQVLKATRIECVITTQIADLASFPKSLVVNAVVKHVRKLVPKWTIPGSVPLRAALARGKAQPYMRLPLNHDDIAFLQYTGGTTGVSKGATLTHGNVVANLEQVSAWLRSSLRAQGEIVITALPLYHIFALVVNGLLFLKMGAKNILIPNPRDMAGFIDELKKHPFTAITGVNTLFNGLLNTPAFSELDFSHLHLAVGGGAAVQKAVAERWRHAADRRLRPDRVLAGRHLHPARQAAVERHDRCPRAIHRCQPARRRQSRSRAGPAGRALRQRPSGDAGLLAIAGGERQGVHA